MSFLMRQVAHCDVCGHEWIVIAAKTPIHCASCKSRKWNRLLPSISDSDPIREAKQDRLIDIQNKRRALRARVESVIDLPGLKVVEQSQSVGETRVGGTAKSGYIPSTPGTKHAPTCKCLICKPPK